MSLSPGTYHRRVPKGKKDNLKFRQWIVKKAAKDSVLQRGLMEMCRNDILFWINTFAWQFNPRHVGVEIEPFVTWDYQDLAILGGDVEEDGERVHKFGVIECIEDQRDIRWPKSREMGASWVVLMCIIWLCLFHSNKKALVISRDEDAVDRPDDPDCLFWKLDFLLSMMPDWMTAGVQRRRMGFKFAKTHSFINGEASTSKAGVGGRAAIALIDEFGQFDGQKGVDVFSRTADTCYCRIFVYTHKDAASMAFDLSYSAEYSSMREIMTHWSQHPEKRKGLYRYDEDAHKVIVYDKEYVFPTGFEFNMTSNPSGGPFPGLRSPWYDNECRRRPARAISMDLDIDPRGATSQFYDAWTISQLQKACTPPLWVGRLKYDEKSAVPLELVREQRETVSDWNGVLRMWIHPKGECAMPAMRCGAGADISAGTGASPTCLSIVDAETGNKVLEYSNNRLRPADAAILFVAICRLFSDEDGNGAMLCWEIQGPGVTFGQDVVKLGYQRIFDKSRDRLYVSIGTSVRPGWTPNKESKLALHEQYRDALFKRSMCNLSKESLAETLHFIYTGNSVEYQKRGKTDVDVSGTEVHHGDLVVADALAWMMVKDQVRERASRVPKSINQCSMQYRFILHQRAMREADVWN